MSFSRLLFCVLVLAGLAACGRPAGPTATLLLLNGHFFTADSTQPRASAVAVNGDRILYVGDEAGARAFSGKNTEIVDLQGAFATPGFIEGHGHFESLGRSLQNLNLLDAANWDEIVRRAAEKAAATPAGDWIEGRGWHQEKWTPRPDRHVNGYPYHDALSAAVPGHPLVLYHASGHGLFANEKAMQLAGISRETPDPPGGRIVRDAAGNPVGMFEENAMALIEKPFLEWKNRRSEAEKRAAFEQAVALAGRECLAKGITSFQDAGSDFWEIAQYRRLAEAGQLPLRLWVMISQPKAGEYGQLAGFPQIGLGRNHLSVRAVKVYFDGALGSYGAWLLEPYADKPGFFGQNTTPVDTLRAVAEQCRRYGLQCCVHAIGDRANREVLDVFGALAPGPDARWRIEHAQHLDPQDIPRFARLGVIASMQAIHCTSDAPFVVKRLGETRARNGAYAWRSLLEAGAALANGTDAPVEDVDPLPCLYASVTRVSPASPGGAAFFAEQTMTREEALLSYTRWNARAAFEEKEKGMLAPGMLADITVWSTDLLHCAPEELLRAKAVRTLVGGKTEFLR